MEDEDEAIVMPPSKVTKDLKLPKVLEDSQGLIHYVHDILLNFSYHLQDPGVPVFVQEVAPSVLASYSDNSQDDKVVQYKSTDQLHSYVNFMTICRR